MKKYSLNHGWQYTEGELRNPLMMNLLSGWRNCDPPHDYQIENARDPRSPAGENEGWTQGAAVFYRKEFVMEPETAGKRCWLEFEGIAGICEIWVNGKYLAKHMNPYTGVIAETTALVHPGENTIQVHVDSRMKPNSRWYVGTGLYRRVWLHLAEPVSVSPEGLRVTTKVLDGDRAVLHVSAQLTGRADAVTFALKSPDGGVTAEVPAALSCETAQADMNVSGIIPWHPDRPAFYEACDELGMLVIEEAFDEWVLGRTDFGLHITFEDRWERDLEDMIRRDYNHPSIIMWSTGNEVEERDGSADGYAWSRRLAEKVRSLDASRPVSASACSLFVEYTQQPSPNADKGVTGNQALNMAYDAFAEGRDLWGPATAEYFAPLDVAGYNYKVARYAYDGEKFPDRVIYGSETYPRAALQNWRATVRNPHVIGDFVWTAWDYIGEVGVGRWEVSDQPRPGGAGYPWLLAHCGDIDILGRKRPQSYYRDVVWGIAKGPRMFCLPPNLVGKNIARLSWGWLPVRRSYTFGGFEGQTVEVHIYAGADLELKNYFGWEGFLSEDTAREVWEFCNEKLQNDLDFTARGFIRRSNVEMIGTMDDPCDSLEWHEKLAADKSFPVRVCPTFRPDKALNLHKPGFAAYIQKLSETVGYPLNTVEDVKRALSDRIAYFAAHGCRAADHGLDYVSFRRLPESTLNAAFQKVLSGEAPTVEETEAWQTELLLHCAVEYARRGLVMQLHYSCLRNPNSRAFAELGPDTGFDCIALSDSGGALANLLDELEKTDTLPRTILYSLNPGDNAFLDTLIGSFQGPGIPGKLQHGSAWWFNDSKTGMTEHLTSLANQSLLGNFIGMLTDSRSFLSYARHEYFRRILCNLLGSWAESGEYPNDPALLGGLVEDICYKNAKRYFNL